MRTVSGPNETPLNASPVTKTCGTKPLRRISLTAAMPLASPSPTSTIIRSGRQCEAAVTALATLFSTAQTVWPRPSSVSASNAPIIASSSTTSVRSAFIEQPPHLRRPRSPRRRRCRATSIRPLQLPTPEQRYWSRAMLPLSSWNRRDCPARSLRSRPFLSYRRSMRFDEPQLMVDAARYLGEQIGCIRVADRRRLSDRFAGRLPERGKCRGDREQVLVFVGDPQGIGDQKRSLGRDLDCPFSGCAKARGALGEQIGIALRLSRDLVEQLVHGDESWSPHVPVRLFELTMQINRRRQVPVQQFASLRADIFG